MSRFYMSQPQTGDVTPTVCQLQFNLAEETLQNVITARIYGVCVCVCAACVCVGVTFNTFRSAPPYSEATFSLVLTSCPSRRDDRGRMSCFEHPSMPTAGDQPKMVTALTDVTLNRISRHFSKHPVRHVFLQHFCKHASVPS